MILTKDQIVQVIPQRPPFVMVDELLKAEENTFVSQFRIHHDNLFLRDKELESYGMIENIAQTTAAGLSVVIQDPEKKPEEGFIGGISNLTVFKNPVIGETITTKVERRMTFGNMYKVYGICYLDDQPLLECELKIVRINN